jgi:hypothetical protein
MQILTDFFTLKNAYIYRAESVTDADSWCCHFQCDAGESGHGTGPVTFACDCACSGDVRFSDYSILDHWKLGNFFLFENFLTYLTIRTKNERFSASDCPKRRRSPDSGAVPLLPELTCDWYVDCCCS